MTTDEQTVGQTPSVPVTSFAHAERRDRFVDDPRRKSVMLAVLLAVMPGLGHVYVGYYRDAFRNIAVVCGIAMGLSTGMFHHRLAPPVVLFLVFFLLFNLVDAGPRASLYNQALAGLRPMDLPDDLARTPARGSLVGGVLLIVAGLVFLANTMFGVPLDWLQQWWPLGFVAGGAWLVYEDWRAKQGDKARPDVTRAEDSTVV
ncbi:MAG: DUF5668 domain-containing protein [Acidobacteria bacterium]|nr:DUF5668 domain-containing protein [Acidobacteriota bacterium]